MESTTDRQGTPRRALVEASPHAASPAGIDMIPVVRKRPTISDVAKLCGVTPATVSRVLNGKRSFSVSDEVRTRIVSTAGKIGYVPDLAARNLNRKNTRIIGVFAAPKTHLDEGINEQLLEGITSVLHPAGYDVFFELTADTSRRQALPFWRFDGAVLMQAPRPEAVAELERRRVPYVCVNESAGSPVGSVLSDDRAGMVQVLDHLAELGHQKIAYAGAPAGYLPHYSMAERYETLLSGTAERGMTVVDGHNQPMNSAVEFLQDAVVSAGATAVVTYDHRLAVMVLGAAYQLRLSVPNDFSLVGFNDQFPVSILPPPLTVVAVSGREIGRTGAELLLEALAAEEPMAKATTVRVAEQLIVRESTAPAPTGAKKRVIAV